MVELGNAAVHLAVRDSIAFAKLFHTTPHHTETACICAENVVAESQRIFAFQYKILKGEIT